jgi:hypothetical protein
MPINYKNYHPKWSLISRLIRFKRAQNKCEWCGAANYEAHIDRDRRNNRFNNLAALCQKCHLNHDRKQIIDSRKYGREYKFVNHKIQFNETNLEKRS